MKFNTGRENYNIITVMCAACLPGTALVIVEKSRDKPIGYTLLANGDQE